MTSTRSTADTPRRPPRQLRVLLVRHGETHENVAKIIQGQLDTPLNAFGHRQAALTGAYLSSVRIHRAISSPLKRAVDTATAIVSQQQQQRQQQHLSSSSSSPPPLELETDPRLMERAFGVLEGKVYNGPRNKRDSTEGIEKMQNVTERLASFWNDLVSVSQQEEEEDGADNSEGEEETVLLVSHGAAISALLNEVLVAGRYVTLAEGVTPSRLWNCSITELVVPTLPFRAGAKGGSRDGAARPPQTAGDPTRRTEWTIRPSHLNVQGIQVIREYDWLRSQIEVERGSLASPTLPPISRSETEARLKILQRDIEAVETLLAKEGGRMRGKLENDVLRTLDGKVVVNDLGWGRGIGKVLRWADTEHLDGLEKEEVDERGPSSASAVVGGKDVNVDELVR